MSNQIPRDIQSFAPAAKLVWLAIENENGITKREIREKFRLSLKTVEHHTSSLENVGLVCKKVTDQNEEVYYSNEL